jgi:hypothetical protein
MSGCNSYNSCYSGSYNPCYSYGYNGYNNCNPCCNTLMLNFTGCICLKNVGSGTASAAAVTAKITPQGCSTGANYIGNTSLPAGVPAPAGGGAIFTDGGCCNVNTGPCNNICLTVILSGPPVITTPTTINLTGCCGGTLTGTPVTGDVGNITSMTLNSTKRTCGGCSTCCITGGVIHFTKT